MTQSQGTDDSLVVVSERSGSQGVVIYPDHILSKRRLSKVKTLMESRT